VIGLVGSTKPRVAEMKDSAPMARLRRVVALVGLAATAAACVPQGLALVQDKRVEVVAPVARATVKVPVTIRWRVEGFRITGRDGVAAEDAGYFGVFVDTTPVPPGKALSWVAHDDRRCRSTPGCPDATYLADHRTYAATTTSFTLPVLPDLNTYSGHELHEVTVVLLDGTGHRIGESAWYVDFYFDRPGV
jgi:hypothetical protein